MLYCGAAIEALALALTKCQIELLQSDSLLLDQMAEKMLNRPQLDSIRWNNHWIHICSL